MAWVADMEKGYWQVDMVAQVSPQMPVKISADPVYIHFPEGQP